MKKKQSTCTCDVVQIIPPLARTVFSKILQTPYSYASWKINLGSYYIPLLYLLIGVAIYFTALKSDSIHVRHIVTLGFYIFILLRPSLIIAHMWSTWLISQLAGEWSILSHVHLKHWFYIDESWQCMMNNRNHSKPYVPNHAFGMSIYVRYRCFCEVWHFTREL